MSCIVEYFYLVITLWSFLIKVLHKSHNHTLKVNLHSSLYVSVRNNHITNSICHTTVYTFFLAYHIFIFNILFHLYFCEITYVGTHPQIKWKCLQWQVCLKFTSFSGVCASTGTIHLNHQYLKLTAFPCDISLNNWLIRRSGSSISNNKAAVSLGPFFTNMNGRGTYCTPLFDRWHNLFSQHKHK